MKRTALPISFLLLFASVASLQESEQKHASEASRVVATYTPAPTETVNAASMSAAAGAFLDSLSDELRARAALELDDPERKNWTNVPPRADERGVRFGDLSEEQLERALDLMANVLSAEGYAQARDIMLGDDLLLRNGQARTGFGVENFWLIVFGTPHAEQKWALQLDGHHLALNITIEGESLCMSPSFIGAQPADFTYGERRSQPMKEAVDAAYALVQSLTDQQLEQARVAGRRGRIVTGPGRDGFVPEAAGLDCEALTDEQRALLGALIREFVQTLPEPHATKRMNELHVEIDDMWFAWSGSKESASDVSYRLQGPSLIVEYACQDLGGDPLDHLHSIYRNPLAEYGQ
ncbi:MAG: hypothetical protein ACI841_004568 [Planctomycetota bacterium]|jgi:hypothetical protein